MSIRYQLGRLLKTCGYKMARDYRWPEVHGNLLLLGFSLLNERKSGTVKVVQIGAFDGHACDPLEEILGNKEVAAVLFEPQTSPYESLVTRYAGHPNVRIINAAVGESDGKVTLHIPASEASPKASLIAQHHSRFGLKGDKVREVIVSSISVSSLVKQFQVEKLDILQVDTEGMDYRILKWFFAVGVEPAIINFESLHLDKNDRQASRNLLREKGYWWIDTSQDTFAIKESLVRRERD
jgi:FkbM family methyltransferase